MTFAGSIDKASVKEFGVGRKIAREASSVMLYKKLALLLEGHLILD